MAAPRFILLFLLLPFGLLSQKAVDTLYNRVMQQQLLADIDTGMAGYDPSWRDLLQKAALHYNKASLLVKKMSDQPYHDDDAWIAVAEEFDKAVPYLEALNSQQPRNRQIMLYFIGCYYAINNAPKLYGTIERLEATGYKPPGAK